MGLILLFKYLTLVDVCYGATTRRKKGAEEVCGGCGREEGKGRRSWSCGGIRSRVKEQTMSPRGGGEYVI